MITENLVTHVTKNSENRLSGLERHSTINGRYWFLSMTADGRLYCFDSARNLKDAWLTVDEIVTIEPPEPLEPFDWTQPDEDDMQPEPPMSAGAVCVLLDRRSMNLLGG